MLSSFRRLSKDVVIYGAGSVSLKILSFFTIPIFTRIFTPSDYGVIETVGAITAVIAVFSTLGLDSASQRSYFDYTSDQEDEREIALSTAFWTLVFWSLCLSVISVALVRAINPTIEKSNSDLLFLIAIITVPVTVIAQYLRDILRMWHWPGTYMMISIFGGVISVGAALYLVVIQTKGLVGNYAGYLVGGAAALLVSYVVVRKAIKLRFSINELKVMVSYGLPLVPVAASTWILQLSDRFFILRFASLEELGLYGLGVKLSSMLLLFVTAFAVAFSPFILDLYSRDKPAEKKVRARALTYVTFLLSFGALGLSIFAREFFTIITDPAFVEAYKAVGLRCGAIVFIGMNAVVMAGITYSRKTYFFARYTILVAVISIVLNIVLIPQLGMVGAALASFMVYFVLFTLYYYRAQKLNPAPYEMRRVCIILGTTFLLIIVGTLVVPAQIWQGILIKVVLLIVFPLLVGLLGGVNEDEKAFVLKRLRAWKDKEAQINHEEEL